MPQEMDTVTHSYKKMWIAPRLTAIGHKKTQSGVPVDEESSQGWFGETS